MLDMYDFWRIHDSKQYDALHRRPVCSVCGQHIQEEEAVYIDDWICFDCIRRYTKEVEDDD